MSNRTDPDAEAAEDRQRWDSSLSDGPPVPDRMVLHGVVLTDGEARIVRRFPIGLPVEAVRDNGRLVYGTVIGHRLYPECEVHILVDTGGRQPHPFDPRRLRLIHGDQRLTIPSGKPGLIVRLLTSLWNFLS